MGKVTQTQNNDTGAQARQNWNAALKNVAFTDFESGVVLDDDTMATATDTTLATSESIKAYVDSGAGIITQGTSAAGSNSVATPTTIIYVHRKTAITGGGDTDTLPDTSGLTAGQVIIVKDDSGAASADNLTIATFGAELIDGQATAVININYGVYRFFLEWNKLQYNMRTLLTIIGLFFALTINAQWYTTSPTAKSAFGLDMVAAPYSVIDLKTTHDKFDELWDEALINSATSTFSFDNSSVTLQTDSVTQAAVRQTYMRFPYQPGKGQRIYFTGIVEPTTGTVKRYGYYNTGVISPYTDSLDGVFFKSSNDTMYVCSSQNGTETCTAQSSWNKSTGASLDWSKAQVFFIQFGWLGYKGVKYGVVYQGQELLLHETFETNVDTKPFMQSPNHSIRAEIRQTSAGAGTNTLVMTCAAVQSEGGLEPLGLITSYNTFGTHIDLAAEDSTYIIFGIKATDGHDDVAVELVDLDFLLTTANHEGLYEVWIRGGLSSGSLSYSSNGTCVDVAQGNGTQVYNRSGIRVASGFAASGGNQGGASPSSADLRNALRIGKSIAGVRDVLYITFTNIAGTTASDLHPSFSIREY